MALIDSIFSFAASYCPSPCVPMGATAINYPTRFYQGSTIEFNCRTEKVYGGSEKRRCMRNKRWSGEDLDCTGN